MSDVAALVSAVALAIAVPLGRALSRWSTGHRLATESFAGGVSLAYVVLDLLVELTGSGGTQVHARLPIGPTEEKSLFAVVLAGVTAWYIVAALTPRRGGARARYLSYAVPHVIYRVVVGGVLAHEGGDGSVALVLFALPMLIHLTIVESHLNREFAREHRPLARAVLVLSPALGAGAWTLLHLPERLLFVALALVAGSTIVQIIQTELPSPSSVQLRPFLAGIGIYSLMVAVRWEV